MIPLIAAATPAAAAAVAQSIVLVATFTHDGIKSGTGWVVESTPTLTQILTAEHVVDGGDSTTVYVGGPHGAHYNATILRVDSLRDAALLEIQIGNIPALQLADPGTPTSGTSVEVLGYPTMREVTTQQQSTKVEDLPLLGLQMVTVAGKVDGEAEEAESILLSVAVTHGDSGAPVIDTTNRVVGMVRGLAGGYGMERWMSGDGIGLSVDGIQGFMHPLAPVPLPSAPAFHVEIGSQAPAGLSDALSDVAASAGFSIDDSAPNAECVDASGKPIANAVLVVTAQSPTDSTIDVNDCSGENFFHDEAETGGEAASADVARFLGRELLGFADSHRAEWDSLLRFGVAADPARNPYLPLMSVKRNPFGQLMVAHTFRGGPSDLAGVQESDAIVKIDGRPTHGLADQFVARLLNQPEVTLLLERREKQITVRLNLQRFVELTKHGPVPR